MWEGHIRPSGLGLDDNLCVRSMKVVKLVSPERVGITLGGGLRIVERIHVNPDMPESPPIYYTRQFLSDNEASVLLASETAKLDTCVLVSRRLTKRTELDDLVRRAFKSTLESILKCEVFVWIASARHRWNGDFNSEESFLIASISALEGGKARSKSLPGFDSGSPYFKLCIGSLELECFRDIKLMINTPWKNSFNPTEVLEISKVKVDTSMGDILNELIGFTSHEILGLAKCDKRSPSDRWDKWLLLISSEGKNWDKDPRPKNWDTLGWSALVKRPGSPSKEVKDTKKYTTLRWDAVGMTVSKVTVIRNPNSSPDEAPMDSVNLTLSAPPREQVLPNGSKTTHLPSGKKNQPSNNHKQSNQKNE